MLLLAGGPAVGFYAYQAAQRYVAGGILFVAPFRGDHFFAEGGAVDDIRAVFPGAALAGRGRAVITRGDRQVLSPVTFCDAAYFNMHFMNFTEGGPWHADEEDASLIILNEALAWYLFGGGNIVGMTVNVGAEFYRIAGVVRQGGDYMAWLPGSGPGLPVNMMYVRQDNAIDAMADARYLIEGRLFHRLSDYAVVDMDRYIGSIAMRHRILLYGLWLYIAALLAMAAQRRGAGQALPLWAALAFCIWVPAMGAVDVLHWLPHSFSNMGTLPPDVYLSYGIRRASQLNSIANYAWLAAAAAAVNLSFTLTLSKNPKYIGNLHL